MNRRQLTIKPTCMREIAAFPSDRAALLWEKIDQLVSDPLPDGKVRKKLKGADGVYRLRVADHRVFYRFSDEWISLLSVRRRREDTYASLPAQSPDALPPEDDTDLDALLTRPDAASFRFTPRADAWQQDPLVPETPSPSPSHPRLLRELAVPVAAIPTLLRCTTEESLLEAAVPSEVLSRVVDRLFPPTLARLDQQPDLLVLPPTTSSATKRATSSASCSASTTSS
jgi:mRNA-degrading endonuclease RelE of RelBE toxin-antitoxin system